MIATYAKLAAVAAIAALALSACDTPPKTDGKQGGEFTVYDEGGGTYLIMDERTTCEYIATSTGGVTLREDPKGNVTPNCAASHNWTTYPLGGKQ